MPVKRKQKKTSSVKAAALSARPEVKSAADAAKNAAKDTANILSGPFRQFQPFNSEAMMLKGNKQFEKMTTDANAFGQEQFDAMSRSASVMSTVISRGMEDLMSTCMEISQSAAQKNQEAVKRLMACKTLNEFTDVQTKLAQSSFDEFMTNLTKLSEKSVKLCTDTFAPINDQMGRNIKRASEKASEFRANDLAA